MERREVYLDHSATTPVLDEVIEVMGEFWNKSFGNPSSIHFCGRENKDSIEIARAKVAEIMGCSRDMVYFTSGGTEGNNIFLKGLAFARLADGKKGHIVTTAIEHKAILSTVEYLETFGFETTILPVDEFGLVSADVFRDSLREDTFMASVMLANNEVGTIEPIADFASICRERDISFHTDAVQAVGKIPIDFTELGLNALTASAHKFYGPKGSGFLILDKVTKRKMHPLFHGGYHENSMRAGTENIAGIVGLAKALEIVVDSMNDESQRVEVLAQRLLNGLQSELDGVYLNGHPTKRLHGLVNLAFDKIEGEGILLFLDLAGIRVSTGSACSSKSLESSVVLKAMGTDIVHSHGSIRFSLGRSNCQEDIDYVLEQLPPIITRLREMSVL